MIEVPDPVPAENEVLVETLFSAISPGTELAELTRQPHSIFSLVQQGFHSFEKIKKSLIQRGWRRTLAKVAEANKKPHSLGYSLVGRVRQVGFAVNDFHPGNWVVAVGPGAHHGSMASVPRLLCARLSKPEMARDAAVAALACVGIHAIHRAELSAGSEVAVLGLGVIGQLTTQALRGCGYRVVAFDPIQSRREDAQFCGAEGYDPTHFDFEKAHLLSSHGQGLDAIFLCAKNDSPEVMRQAAALCRKRGRMMIVGEFPLILPRESAHEKELEVRLCAAYGEGRYDPVYEHLDQDYPLAHSRWTVQRNLYLFLRWLEEGKINLSPLRPEVVSFTKATSIYSKLPQSPSVVTIFQYDHLPSPTLFLEQPPRSRAGSSTISIAVVGAGRFATETHLPNLHLISDQFELHTILGQTPTKVAAAAARFYSKHSSCDLEKTLRDPSLSAVLIATPHSQHAWQTLACLEAGKHVYVEKPLCLHFEEIDRIQELCKTQSLIPSKRPVLFVGFNRRYAPLSQKILESRLQYRQPIDIRYLFQAPPLPHNEWYNEPTQGGRFLGEVCHAVDWILWLMGCPLQSNIVFPGLRGAVDIFLHFSDSSRAHLRFQPVWRNIEPKEIVEIQQDKWKYCIEDFLQLKIFKHDSFTSCDRWKSKGHREALTAFAGAIAYPKEGEDPYGFLASSRLILELNQKLHG